MRKLSAALMFLFVFCYGYVQVKSETRDEKSPETITGYLVDKMCGTKMAKLDDAKATEKAMKHTKDCALEDMCKEDGYGVVSNGKFIKFDENGDKLASAYFDKSEKESNFLVDVKGTIDGDVLKVESIVDAQGEPQKSEMKESHNMTGYLLDNACATKMSKLDEEKATEKAMKHPKDCALQDACKASGYGIMSKGKFIKFDENGNKLAIDYFDKTKKENGFLVVVKGTMDGGVMKVESIQDVKAKVKGKKMEKEEKEG